MSEAVGRAHITKKRADAKEEMGTNMRAVCKSFVEREAIVTAKEEVKAEQRIAIIGGGMTSSQIGAAKDKIILKEHQLSAINARLYRNERMVDR